ncbi:hypothetical protein V8E53_004086 [Lactarius tabidus]
MTHPRMYEYEGILLSKHCVTVTLATKVLSQVDVGRDVQYFHSEGSSSYHCKNHLQHMQNRRVRIMSVYGNSVLLRALHGTTVGELSLITVYILSLYQLQYLWVYSWWRIAAACAFVITVITHNSPHLPITIRFPTASRARRGTDEAPLTSGLLNASHGH